MRLPSVRLPSVALPSDLVEGLLGRRTLLYALYTTALFLVFLLVNFPYHDISKRVIDSLDLPAQGLRFEHADTRFAWWRGLELQRVKFGPSDPAVPPFVEAASIYVRPGLDGLVRGQLNSVDLLGLLYGGAVGAHLAAGDGLRRATVTVDGVQLQRYPGAAALLSLQEGSLGGKLSGVITIETHGGDDGETRAAAELNLANASLTDAKLNSGIILPPLHFDKAALKLNLQAGRLEVQELEANGPEVEVSASGQIALRKPLQDSVLNLKFVLVPGENSPEDIQTLLSLLPQPPKGAKADAARTISGTLARPRIR
jgi:type II secretion system protein N